MSFRNTSRLSNSIDPDNAQHFNLNLPSTKFISEIALAGKILMFFKFNIYIYIYISIYIYIYIYIIPNSLFLVNSLNLNFRHKLFTY